MKKICPNCGKHTISLLQKVTSTRFFRFFKKPARCQNCRGYYKTYIGREYFFTVIFRALVSTLILTSILMLSTRLRGYLADVSIIPNIILIAVASLLFFLVFDLFFTGIESCNHNYQLIEHDIDLVLKNKNFSPSAVSGIYTNNIISMKCGDTIFPVIIKKIMQEKKKCGLAVGFVNPSFYPVEEVKEGETAELIKNGRTIAEFKVKTVVTYK